MTRKHRTSIAAETLPIAERDRYTSDAGTEVPVADTVDAGVAGTQQVVAALMGHAVGDALGVPVEFCSREQLTAHPVTDMRGYGTHRQPPGTWSDDTSLTLCTAESLCDGDDLRRMGQAFVRWLFECHRTPHGHVFDIDVTTHEAIDRLTRAKDPTQAGPVTERSNGNGSLMRILPVALHCSHDDEASRRSAAMAASCLTHGHIRSQLACAFYAEVVARLIHGGRFAEVLSDTQTLYRRYIQQRYPGELGHFEKVLDPDLPRLPDREISGSGYVLDCLSASLWCCATRTGFEDAVLSAVNLGLDTDTTGAVTGGLAAIIHGASSVPRHWLEKLARVDDIQDLYERFAAACIERWKARAT